MTINPRTTKTRRMLKMKWRPSRTKEITDSRAGIAINHRDQVNTAIPEAGIIATGTGNTVSTARSRITLKKNAERE